MMRNHMRSLMLGAMGLALLAGSAAAQVTVTSALRSVYAQAIGYDWDFYGGDSDLQSSNATTGDFNAAASVDVQEWYGGQVGAADAIVSSYIAADAIEASYDLTAACVNVGVYAGDAQADGNFDVTFAVASTVRAVVSLEAYVDGSYAYTFASFSKVGTPGSLLGLSIWGQDDGSVSLTRWLQPGSYRLQAEASAWAFGTYGTTDIGTNVTNVSIHFFHAADFNLDGQVTTADRSAFLTAYNASSLAADFNGDGVITVQDRQGFLAAYKAANQ